MQSGRRGQQRGTGPKVKAQQNLRPRWPSPYAHRARIFHIMKMWLGKWWWSLIVTTWSNNKIQILEFSRIQDDIACTHTVKNNPFLNFREGPLKFRQALFGHCPNSNCTPLPALKWARASVETPPYGLEWGFPIGTPAITKTDEFSEKFQTTFDPPLIFGKLYCGFRDKSAYVHMEALHWRDCCVLYDPISHDMHVVQMFNMYQFHAEKALFKGPNFGI